MRCKMAGYSEDFKKSVVRKALLPESPGAARIAEEAGISLQTLYHWLRKLRAGVEMGRARDPKDRSVLEKHELVLEAASIAATDLGGWMRERGIHEEHLRLWKGEVRDMLKHNQSAVKRDLSEERRKVKALEKELRKKDRALAEVTALMVLKKKLEGILFEPEGEL
jgi:transposase